MIFQAVSQVEGYWHGLYDTEGTIPERAAIDPRGIDQVLEYAMLMERIAPGIARIRLAGMHLTDILGMEVRGMPLTAFFVPALRADIGNAIENVCTRSRIVDIDLRSNSGSGRDELKGRMFMAPLLDERGKPNRILACLQTRGQIGRTPRRFDNAICSSRSLKSARDFVEFHQQTGVPAQGMAEAAAPFGGASEKRPHLRLVYSADDPRG